MSLFFPSSYYERTALLVVWVLLTAPALVASDDRVYTARGVVQRPGVVSSSPATTAVPETFVATGAVQRAVPPEEAGTQAPATAQPASTQPITSSPITSPPVSSAPITSPPISSAAVTDASVVPQATTSALASQAPEEAADDEPDHTPVYDVSIGRNNLRNETVAFEDFENGNDFSWTHQRVTQTEFFSSFLGRFGQAADGSDAFTNTSKTYRVPALAERIGVEFDFFELDLWCHCDHLHILICNQTVDMGEFSQSGPSNQSGTAPGGIEWWRHATARNVDLGFSHYRDGTHHMGITVPQNCYQNGHLEVKFNITIDGEYELASAGIDNINITAYNIPPKETRPPTMAPSPFVSAKPTMPMNLDVCLHDVMYDLDAGKTVHKKCFDLMAKIEMVDRSEVIGKACVETIDNENLQLEVHHRGTWVIRRASAWIGEVLTDVLKNNSQRMDFHKFQATRTWHTGSGDEWITSVPLKKAVKHCASGLTEFSQLMVVHILGSGPGEQGGTIYYQGFAREHFYDPGNFFWVDLSFSCHCDRTIALPPPPTAEPTAVPSIAPTSLPSANPSSSPTASPTTMAPTQEPLVSKVGTCLASADGSGRECHPLIGEDKTWFGEVCIELAPNSMGDPNDTLNVTVSTTGDYRLIGNHLWVGNKATSKPPMILHQGLMEEPWPDLKAFPHFHCNSIGSKKWTELVSVGSQCSNSPDGTVLRMSLVAHSEVAKSQPDGKVALGATGTKAFGTEHTWGTVGEASWFETIDFKVICQCNCLRSRSGRTTQCDTYTEGPSPAPSAYPTEVPTKSPSKAPTERPSLFPSMIPSFLPSLFPSSHAPTPAPTVACRPAWAIKEGSSHCFKSINSLRISGWYNGIFHLEDNVTLNLYAEVSSTAAANNATAARGATQCKHGEKVGTARFSALGKVVTVELATIGDFYITETQAHVGSDYLPKDATDGHYLMDPQEFELQRENLPVNTRRVDHYLRGCQEDNWVVARAVVCGSFDMGASAQQSRQATSSLPSARIRQRTLAQLDK